MRIRDVDESLLSPEEMEQQEAKKRSALDLWSNAGGSQLSDDDRDAIEEDGGSALFDDLGTFTGPGSGSPNPMKGRKRRGSLTRRR